MSAAHDIRSRTGPRRSHLGRLALGLLLVPAFIPASTAEAQDFGIPPTVLRRIPLPDHATLMLAELHRPATVRLTNGTVLRGSIGDATATDLVLMMDEYSLMEARMGISWAQISSVRVQRNPRILEGVLLGGLGGALYGLATPRDGGDRDRTYLGLEAPDRVWDTSAQGVVVGAVLGLLGGVDVMLPFQPESFGLGSLIAPGQRSVRPTWRVITTAPLHSVTRTDIRESIQASQVPNGIEQVLAQQEGWNGQPGSTVAWETSWQADANWWARSRIEWSTLPTVTAWQSLPPPPLIPLVNLWEIRRSYGALRTLVGFVRPIGAVKRLPLLELGVLGGISWTRLNSEGIYHAASGEVRVQKRQKRIRPLLLLTGSLALLRRPTLGIALRAETALGPGFTADALMDNGTVLIPKHRITPIGVSIGLELYFPRF